MNEEIQAQLREADREFREEQEREERARERAEREAYEEQQREADRAHRKEMVDMAIGGIQQVGDAVLRGQQHLASTQALTQRLEQEQRRRKRRVRAVGRGAASSS